MLFAKTPRLRSRGVFVCLWFAVAGFSGGAWAAGHCALKTLPSHLKPATVTIASITDGDTVRLKDGRRVRLIGVNAPEMNPQQPYALEAKRAVEAFIPKGSRATLVLDREKHDNHGRVLGHVFNAKGESLEAHLLAQGLAWHIAVPPNLSLADCLAEAQRAAQSRKLALWRTDAVSSKALRKGGFQRVQGRVEKITFSKAWWINFEGGLAAVIYPEHQHRFRKSEVARLKGDRIEVQGWVYGAAGPKPWRMKLETPHGMTRPDP